MSPQELLFAALLSRSIPQIDLHAARDVHEASRMLEQFLYSCKSKRCRSARIIQGFGAGVLKSMVSKTLRNHPLVAAWEQEDHGGSCVVAFE